MTEFMGTAERIARFMLSPRLHIDFRGKRCIEDVSIRYKSEGFTPFDSPGSTASTNIRMAEASVLTGTAKYVRAWVYNSFGYPARHCRVIVDQIWKGENLLDDEPSELHWADKENTYELDRMERGIYNGAYVDLCFADSVDGRLHIASLRGLKRGYHIYEESGTYRLLLTARAVRPCAFGYLDLLVRFDRERWEGLSTGLARPSCDRFPWW